MSVPERGSSRVTDLEPPPAEPVADAWAYLAYCPNCGARLEKRQCKARCLRCGFFHDCSDTLV
ncbi:MAG: hypothetical protein QOD06_2854 [Candidatus Binatota bacterium]|nr:hypothetical protein [Candidatus Binatota bacterium]